MDKSDPSGNNLDFPTENALKPMDGLKSRRLLKSDYGYGTDYIFPSSALTSTTPIFRIDDFETIDDCDLVTTPFEKLTTCAAEDSLNNDVFFENEISVRDSGNLSGNGISLGLMGIADDINDNENDINNETYALVGNVSSKTTPILILGDLDKGNACNALSCSEGLETRSTIDSHTDVRGIISTSGVQMRPKNVHDNQAFIDSPGARVTGNHNGLHRRGDGQKQHHAGSETKPRDRSMSLPDVQLYELQSPRQKSVGRALRRMSDEFYYSQLTQSEKRRLSVQNESLDGNQR